MCVVSMVMDHYAEKWAPLVPNQPYNIDVKHFPVTSTYVMPVVPQADVDEFYALLKRAREYDKRNNEPNCELQEKKDTLTKLAKQLGVEIEFPDD